VDVNTDVYVDEGRDEMWRITRCVGGYMCVMGSFKL